jgi:phospholipase D1/2
MTIFAAGQNVWRIEDAARFAVLIDGAAFFDAVRQAALRAKRSILIMGWDLDSATRLVGDSGQADDGYPAELAPFLSALVKERPDLRVHILLWDYSLLYLSERERFPLLELQWRTPPGVQFSLDDHVPPGSSQHQKIVVVDDSVAFSGGLDITGHRWDTFRHELNNPWRIDTARRPYRPFHDVQAMVDGPAARALAQIVRERWLCATGQKLPTVDVEGAAWPHKVKADLTDVRVGIARTQPAMNRADEVREVERLFLDSIDAAERSIYIENQFFTSSLVAERLAKRLRERPELEVLMIGPQHYDSWLEARTMRNGRIRFMRILAEAGAADRVRLLYPHVQDSKTASDTMVHSKVMIVDDRLLRVGSANVNNRSMGTDTECDLGAEAVDDRQLSQIASVRNRLLADHCGANVSEVADCFASGMGLLQVAHSLSRRGHSLRPIDDGEPDPREMADYVEHIADPERPIAADAFAALELQGRSARASVATLAKFTAALFVVLGLTAAWSFTPLSELLDGKRIQTAMTALAASPSAVFYVLAAFLAGGLVAFPVTLMIAGTAAAFGPTLGFTYAALGSLASAVLTYAIGAWLGRGALQSALGPRLNRIREAICRSGILAIAAIRLVPIAPFTVVNMVAGACGIRFVDYVVGTTLGLLPGLLTLSLVGHQIFRFFAQPSPADFLMLAAALTLWLVVVLAAQRLAMRARSARP